MIEEFFTHDLDEGVLKSLIPIPFPESIQYQGVPLSYEFGDRDLPLFQVWYADFRTCKESSLMYVHIISFVPSHIDGYPFLLCSLFTRRVQQYLCSVLSRTDTRDGGFDRTNVSLSINDLTALNPTFHSLTISGQGVPRSGLGSPFWTSISSLSSSAIADERERSSSALRNTRRIMRVNTERMEGNLHFELISHLLYVSNVPSKLSCSCRYFMRAGDTTRIGEGKICKTSPNFRIKAVYRSNFLWNPPPFVFRMTRCSQFRGCKVRVSGWNILFREVWDANTHKMGLRTVHEKEMNQELRRAERATSVFFVPALGAKTLRTPKRLTMRCGGFAIAMG